MTHGALPTDGVRPGESGQAALWNGPSGQAWVEAQDLLDHLLQPFADLLVDAVAALPARCVLDVGCGTGGTTLAVARRIGDSGQVVGVDISEPMIAAAGARARREGVSAAFIHADAQAHRFEPGRFDAIMSRFGVMFFDDPVQAFANLRRAAAPAAALRCIAWRGPEENPFMMTAERAAAPLIPIPSRPPGTPGQFAFADRTRVQHILDESGWSGVDITPIDVSCTLPEPELLRYVTRFGPLSRAFPDVDEVTRRRVIDVVRRAFDPYVHGAVVRFDAACWLVSARA